MLSMRVRNLSKSVLLVIKGTVIPDSWHHHAFFLALKPIFMFQGCFKEVLDYVLSFSGQFLAIYLPFILIQVLIALKRDNIPSNDQFTWRFGLHLLPNKSRLDTIAADEPTKSKLLKQNFNCKYVH